MTTPTNRTASIQRETKETQIDLTLGLQPSKEAPLLETPLPFFNHMLNTLACHGQFSLAVKAKGDIEVDPHHLIEDVGIVLGKTLVKALGGELKGIVRAGCFSFPMDSTLAIVAIDLCGRPNLVWNVSFGPHLVGHLDPNLFREFFKGFVDGAQATVHVQIPYQDNDHHVVESIFKAFARSLNQAVQPLPHSDAIMSTKGMLDVSAP
jgi:imidazoleglycerol-phosphate dehydratase